LISTAKQPQCDKNIKPAAGAMLTVAQKAAVHQQQQLLASLTFG